MAVCVWILTAFQCLDCEWIGEVSNAKVIHSSNSDGVVCEGVESCDIKHCAKISCVLHLLLPTVVHLDGVEA